MFERRSEWLAVGSIVVLALGAVWPALAAEAVAGSTVDLFGTLWFQWWVEWCLETGTAPGFTELMFHPLGKDIFAHTGNNFIDALVAQPFRWFLSFPGQYNWFLFLLLLGNAWSFERLLRDLVEDGAARWAGTVLWTFNPFVLFELNNGRPTQAFLWFLPLAIRHFLRVGDGGWRHPILAGVFTALQAWVYWFLGFFLVFTLVFWALLGLLRPRCERVALVRGWALAALACLLSVGPFVWAMAASWGEGAVVGLAADGGGIFDRPRLSGNSVASGFQGYLFVEQVAQPMFLTLIWGGGLIVSLWRRRSRWWWGAMALLSLCFAIGPVLFFADGESLLMPHYMVLYRYVPFFSRLWFPYRWIVMALLGVAVGLAWWMQSMKVNGSEPWRRYLPVLLVAVAMGEQVHLGAFPLVHRSLRVPAVMEEIRARGGGVVDLPMGMVKASIVWQTVHEQPTFGGMGENAQVLWPEGMQDRFLLPFTQSLRKVVRAPKTARSEEGREKWSLVDEGFRWLVLDRAMIQRRHQAPGGQMLLQIDASKSKRIMAGITRMLGEPVAVDGRVVIWDLTGAEAFGPPYTPTTEGLEDFSWVKEDVFGVLEAPLRRIQSQQEVP